VVELIYTVLNSRFDMSVIFTDNYSFSGRRRPINNESFLVTDFVNLKIKLTQSFKNIYRGKSYVYIFIGIGSHIYLNIYIYTILIKQIMVGYMVRGN
jgi:hypothetical protein